MSYKGGNYTNKKGGENYDDTWAAIKVVSVISFLVWFGFIA
jgi:hypothetical protein